MMNDAKKKESDAYVAGLADQAMDDPDAAAKSPIETVFKLNLRNGLLEFEKHCELLSEEKQNAIQRINTEIGHKILKNPEQKADLEIQKQLRIEQTES
jgi:hypothetical protein